MSIDEREKRKVGFYTPNAFDEDRGLEPQRPDTDKIVYTGDTKVDARNIRVVLEEPEPLRKGQHRGGY